MGGNALSVPSTRLDKKSYELVSAQCVAQLRAAMPNSRIAVIEAYGAKESFGDCDILVATPNYDPYAAAAALGGVEVVRNGPTTSVGIVVPEGMGTGLFQVDLIYSDAASFDYALAYYAYNDLGNLIGRTAHRAGLKHGHEQLTYPIRNNDRKARDICLTKDYNEALRFLGYDPDRFNQGFNTLEEIFEYVTSSAYFNREIFLLENRNYKSRVRDRDRYTYTEFLKYCEARPDLPAYQYPEDKAEWRPRIAEHFPAFEGAYAAAMADIAGFEQARKRFNGEWVTQVTGLQGKELGILMSRFNDSFDSAAAKQAYLLVASQEDLEQRVKALHVALMA